MLEEMLQDITQEFQDEDGADLVPEEVLRRIAERMLPLVATALDVPYVLGEDDNVTPEMPGQHREVWVLRCKVQCCRFLRTQSAGRVSFSSGDKSMDRSKEASNWASLEKDMAAEYQSLVSKLNPLGDDSILTPEVFPVRYRTGHRRHHHHDHHCHDD